MNQAIWTRGLCVLLLSFLPAAAAMGADPAPQEKEEGFSTRIYSLENMTMTPEGAQPRVLRLAPFLSGPYLFDDTRDEIVNAVELGNVEPLAVWPEQIADFLVAAVGGEQFEHDGSRLEDFEGNLLVRAPETVHRRIGALLSFLESRLQRKVAIGLEVFEAGPEAPASFENEAAVREAAANGLLRPLLERTVKTRAGDLVEIRDGADIPFVETLDAEVAQSSAVTDPAINRFFDGLWLAMRPLAAQDGENLLIGFFALVSHSVEPVQARDLRLKARVCTENGRFEEKAVSASIDDPRVEFASLAGIVAAGGGKTAVLASAFPHESGRAGLVVLLKAELEAAPDKIDLGGGKVLAALDFSHFEARELLPLHFDRRAILPWGVSGDYDFPRDGTITNLGPHCRLYFNRTDSYYETITGGGFLSRTAGSEEDGIRSFILGDHIFILAGYDAIEEFRGLARKLAEPRSGAVPVVVDFVAVPGPATRTDAEKILEAGDVIGEAALPVAAGGKASAVAGLEGLTVTDYEVDVANNVGIARPLVQAFIDGVLVHIKHRPPREGTGGGAGSVHVLAHLNRLRPPITSRNLGERGGILGVIDEPRFDRSLIDASFAVDGAFHLLGSVTTESEGGPVVVYALGRAGGR